MWSSISKTTPVHSQDYSGICWVSSCNGYTTGTYLYLNHLKLLFIKRAHFVICFSPPRKQAQCTTALGLRATFDRASIVRTVTRFSRIKCSMNIGLRTGILRFFYLLKLAWFTDWLTAKTYTSRNISRTWYILTQVLYLLKIRIS